MRTAFFNALSSAAAGDERVWLVVGDLGYGVVEKFAQSFPDRYVNAGVAEQNMAGLAAGIALSGNVVFTYSIANFPTLRCLEQIRNDICYHGANVKIVSVGGGLAYGQLGMRHHATEDIAIMRALPGMTVIAPGDPVQAGLALQAVIDQPGPCYVRLGRAGERVIHRAPPRTFALGKAITVRDGRDVTLVSTGGMLPVALDAADALQRRGVSARLVSMHTIKPLDVAAVESANESTGAIVTLEEHSVTGGLGSAVAEALCEMPGRAVPFLRSGLPSEFVDTVGDQAYLRKRYGLDAEAVTSRVLSVLEGAGEMPLPRVASSV